MDLLQVLQVKQANKLIQNTGCVNKSCKDQNNHDQQKKSSQNSEMGQQQTIPYKEYQKEYTIVSKNENDELLIRHKLTGKQYMLRKDKVNSEQQLEEKLKIFNRRKKIKSEHLLNIVDFKPINDDRICGNAMYVSLLIEYPFQSLYYETLHRLSYPQTTHRSSASRLSPLHFQQHELWSILYSCALGLEALYSSDMVHESITKSLIFIDKEGVVKIGDPLLLGAMTNYDKVIQLAQQQNRIKQGSNKGDGDGTRNFYTNDKNQAYLKRLHHIKQFSTQNNKNSQSSSRKTSSEQLSITEGSIIISPQLISLCKDHKYYYFDKEKSDVYILGAIMLELTLLENVASFNVKENKFNKNFSQLFVYGSKLREKYSAAFLSIIEDMINIDPKKRPSLSDIVGRIQQFSIQQNSQSDRNSFKKNPTQTELINRDQNSNIFNRYLFNEYSNPTVPKAYYNLGNDIKGLESNKFQTGNLGLASSLQNYKPDLVKPFDLKQTISLISNTHHFPSFSLPKDQNKNQSTAQLYEESAVKSIFSKKMPVQIKVVQSPYIFPVSNIRDKEQLQRTINPIQSTPFHNLNLTESNEKYLGREIQKQSVVKTKITLFGHNNITGDQLFSKVKSPQIKNEQINTQRFSLNNFGKIQIPNNLSNPTSVYTSMLPTPRFQNPFSFQSVSKINQVNKPIIPFNFDFSLNQMQLNPINSNNNSQHLSTFNSFNLNSNQSNLTPYLKIGSSLGSVSQSYDPKKQGFIIHDDNKERQSKSIDNGMEPYFSNSSVGYTLPKYRPDSTFSEVTRQNTQQKIRCTSANNPIAQTFSARNIAHPNKQIKQTESFLQRVNSSPHQRNSEYLNSNSVISAMSHLIHQNNQTHSNASSQNTVKKETQNYKKNSNSKKYNFYKKQINQDLQKITQQPTQIVSILKSPLAFQDQLFSLQKQKVKYSEMQNSITQVQYNSQNHTVFVQQQLQKGCVYRGSKLNNKRHGNGVLVYADSGFYEGQFHNDQIQGQGKLYYNLHDLAYQGQFFQNTFHGHGILYNNHAEQLKTRFDFANLGNLNKYWIKYDGYFKQDQKSGKCHVYLINGEQFQGFCHNDTFQGSGHFKTLDGDYIEGVWRNNVLIEIKNQGKIYQLQN